MTTPQSTADAPVLAGLELTKSYGTNTVLHNASIAIRPQESLAVMGPSGSGKSTLLHILSGIVKPDSGTVLFRGQPIHTWKESKRTELRRTAFGFVFQAGQLLPELPAIENVALPLILNGMPIAAAKAQAAAFFAPLGISGLEMRRPGEMSGGQAQRVAIARALVARPAVLFADEPTGALDAHTSAEVMRLLRETSRHMGTALVVVTHDSDVAAFCDRTIGVHEGTLVERTAQK
ncbi:ABC transporter ATP-binding protein [Hoyosella rhizosphaerae]|uniref:ABC transporter domain-containing protein n=1 Tax=Hoyosella rhizosphaerae TaxID=1755582 RepID=A0A916UFZ9_9ACTN|nr:ABC transporter ATP-binding protein [Hoyosella rhizosphaerae]MBN4928004.1 ABC transporter ATP-binding protein [Hoyosella rhizosphaerae]GGC71631.1 hypothetical protein GCM10011410_25790 [Hoyosella rhizosphaerae]